MAAKRSPEELLQLEAKELTGLLRQDGSFADLGGTPAARGIPGRPDLLGPGTAL